MGSASCLGHVHLGVSRADSSALMASCLDPGRFTPSRPGPDGTTRLEDDVLIYQPDRELTHDMTPRGPASHCRPTQTPPNRTTTPWPELSAVPWSPMESHAPKRKPRGFHT